MKKIALLFILLFVIVSEPLSAQQRKPTFIEIDTAMYRAYLNKDWNKIIKMGKLGLNNGIDYYYLRLRMGYAYFMKKQYRMAIPYYQAALRFSSKDATAMEFLYYSYLYGDRFNDAEKLTQRFTPALKEYVEIRGKNALTEISFFPTFGTGASDNLKETVNLMESETTDGSQILPNSFSNYNLNISHKAGSNVVLNHSLNLLSKDEYAIAIVDRTPYLSESQVVKQFSYRIAVDITSTSGFTLSPALTYINYRVPVYYEYGAGLGNNRTVYSYNAHNEIGISLKATKQAGPVSIALSGSYSNLNLSNQITGAASITYYPFGNLNLYTNATGYYHLQSQKSSSINQIIQSYKLGLKLTNNLWIEGFGILGDFSNLIDPFSGITYNSLEIYHSIYGVNVYIPFNKNGVSLFVGYRNYNSTSQFIPVENVFEGYNNITFNYQTFTGGIIWKL
ncbi:MAG: hypothetical protein JXR65_08680 [Bacteroidales bacterium]|nr:hypothetical protein [Bacteroidales bacterium]